MLTDTEENSV